VVEIPVKSELQWSQLTNALATVIVAVDIVKYFLTDAKLCKARKYELLTEEIGSLNEREE
jgi:hypothetical protein